jgi:cardiolipin synthase
MLGSFLDPLADKILVSTLFLSLTYVQLIPIALTSLVVSRDIFLVYAGLYVRYMGVVPPVRIHSF